MKQSLLLAVLLLGVSSFASASSVFSTRLDDPKAVYLTAQEFGDQGDGIGRRQRSHPGGHRQSGKQRRRRDCFCALGPIPDHAHHVCVAGGALIGYGATRPVFLLAANTPGFQRAWESW